MAKTLIDTLTVRQDVGFYEPQYKNAILDFWSDGSVTWRTPETGSRKSGSYVGDTK